MQDILVGLSVAAALYFVIRNLWSKAGARKQGGGCCGCSGCGNRRSEHGGTCGEEAQSSPLKKH